MTRARSTRRTPHRRGITLVEVVLSSVVLAFVATGALRLLVAVVDRRELAVRDSIGAGLADQMLAEAMARRFEAVDVDSGTEFGASASEGAAGKWGEFDDCDDFNGWKASPPQTANGATLTGREGWTRRVSVDYVTTADLETPIAGPSEVKRITVEVEYLGKPVATRVGWRTWAGQRTVEDE